ncbi:cupin domain-containing protein [Microbacterium sp. STN6]|uniref:cupin domain-containing protein n=1 Tax=Microbacterium sp. STN6 TaxID=2995588 RepID=UPI002260EB0D|nr:cupin domain-containing protein [Microbacterium sp. STN6]MCX7523005.1 cupin domain-containing protein [Microbacterium sp. STN6]
MSENAIYLSSGLDELLAQAPIDDERLKPKRVLDGFGARVVLLAFAAGQELREHSAPVPILVQTLAGRVAFEVDGAETELAAGGIVNVAAGVRHAVRALEPSHVLLTLLG